MHPHRHVRSRLGRQGNLPIDPGRSTPSIALSHLSHTDQRVRPGTRNQFLQRPDRGPVLLPRRLEDPAPQPRYVLLMDAPIHDAPIENALRSVHLNGVQLALPVREIIGIGVQRLTCSRQRPFEPSHQDWYPTGSPQPPSGRRTAPRSRVPLPFGYRPSLLEHPFPPRSSAPLTIGLPAPKSRPPTGFPRSPHTRYDRGGRPLYPETSGVRKTGLWPPVAARRHFQRQVLHPGNQPVDLSFN